MRERGNRIDLSAYDSPRYPERSLVLPAGVFRACGGCGRVFVAGAWRTSSRRDGRNRRLTHGYCPDCYTRAIRAIMGL